MDLKRLGATDLRTSPVGVGCARIGGIFERDPRGSLDLLSAALDAGINFFDTSDIYSQGESEALLGQALRGRRDRVVIATKGGYRLPAQRRLVASIKPLVRPLVRLLRFARRQVPATIRGQPSHDFSPAHLRRAIEGSLRRLRTDRIDLFQLHSPDADVVARAAWLPALEALQRQGKIRWFGVSCDSVEAALAALRLPAVATLQLPVSLLEHGIADAVLPAARERNVAVIAREVLGNGLLVKAPAQIDLVSFCGSPEEAARREGQLTQYRQTAAAQGVPLAKLALQFAMSLPGVGVTLLGVRTREQLAEVLRLLPMADGGDKLPGGSMVS
jgi:aryl-alcohol dehydrogenase-like predicted oxidoreductase